MAGHKRGVPILVVITVATFLSTAASLGGGLMMYLEGLASLQESVRTTSASEVDQLRVATLAIFDRTATYGKAMRTFLWSTERLPPGSTMDEAVSLSRSLFHAEVKNSGMLYYISYHLIPRTTYLSRNITYAVVWGDVRRSGDREMMFAEYGPHLPDSARVQNADNPLAYDAVMAQAYRLNDTTGELGPYQYSWDLTAATTKAAEGFDVLDANGVPQYEGELRQWLSDDDGGETGIWLGPGRFPATDGFISAYTTLQLMLKPPPPPHPWSGENDFVLFVGFLTQVLSDAFVQQKALQPDMEAMLAERSPKGSYVYASTLGLDIVPPRCQGANLSESFGLYTKDGCHLQVANMPAALRDAYTYLADKQAGEMYLVDVGGSEHFVRRQLVVHDWEIVWIKTTSSVESEVQGALRLLILFTALVLLFDITIAVSEVYFIGLPLAAVARTVEQIGQMRTSVAATMLHTMQQQRVMLREMCTVVDGLVWAVQQLDEYRTFMPSAVLEGDGDDSSTSDEESIRGSKMSQSHTSRTSSRSTTQAKVAQNTSLALHVVSRNVGLLLVNCVGWSQTPDYRDASRLVASHEALVGYVISVCTSWTGVLQSFSGDRILMAWNAGTRCSDLAVRMGSSAVALAQNSTLKLSSAFSIGQAFCGTMGTAALRRFSIVSDVLPWVHLMEGLNKMRGWHSTTDHAVAERLEGRISYRVGDGLRAPRTGKIVAVVEVLQMLENKDGEEWMYQLEASTEDGKETNEAVLHIIHQRWDAVKVLPVLPPCLEHITAAHAGRCFTPMTQSYYREPQPVVADTEGKSHN